MSLKWSRDIYGNRMYTTDTCRVWVDWNGLDAYSWSIEPLAVESDPQVLFTGSAPRLHEAKAQALRVLPLAEEALARMKALLEEQP